MTTMQPPGPRRAVASSMYDDAAVRYDPRNDHYDDQLPTVSPAGIHGDAYPAATAPPSSWLPGPRAGTSLRAMTVVEDGSRVAFCCYNEARNEIVFEECVAATYESVDVVEKFLTAVRPNMLLIGNRVLQNERLCDVLTRSPPHVPSNEFENGDDDDDDDDDDNNSKTGPSPVDRSKVNNESGSSFGGMSPSTIPYQVLKTGCFDVSSCKTLILQKLRVLSIDRQNGAHHFHPQQQHDFYQADGNFGTYATSNFHSLAAIIDFDSKVMVQALGSLLSFLLANLFQLQDGGLITINRIVPAKLADYMQISSSTMAALQIFSTEQHPLLFAEGRGNSKEGFSLFSYLDRTKSRGGRQKLREWMLKPLSNLREIVTRHDIVSFFLQPSVEMTVGKLMGLLKMVRAIDKIILRMNKVVARPNDFLDLSTTLSVAISIANVLRDEIVSVPPQSSGASKLCYDYLSYLYSRCNCEVMVDLKGRIADMVDEEAMVESGNKSVIIRHGYDEILDELRRQEAHLDERLRHAGICIKQRLGGSFENLWVTFAPQMGYLVALNAKNHAAMQRLGCDGERDDRLPDDFEYVSSQDGDDFYRCEDTMILEEEYGDLVSIIKDTEERIVSDMEGVVLDTESELQDCFDALSELDCLLSFTECAVDRNFARPRMIDAARTSKRKYTGQDQGQSNRDHTHVIDIKEGRHPLQELTSESSFVPNDIEINSKDCVNVVTGPNFSGKSCYLRQVGLLVYMAHIGSFIPCSSATISLTDYIGTRIPTADTCSRPQSSYQLELTEVSSILRRATSKSLVIIDEFGKGTNPFSGISILGATLKKFAQLRCPTVCATHLIELFSMKVIFDGHQGIRARRMTIKLPDEDSNGRASPLFKLEDGITPSSAASVCAESAGISQVVLGRTMEIVRTRRSNKSIHRLWTAEDQVSISDEEKHLLLKFSSGKVWDVDHTKEISELLKQAARLPHRHNR